jgi:solute carrier family 8 (sodium/calcium exchanger)
MVEVEEPVWNWVVANITLMACGSSAPEILLAVVEAVIRLNEHPGELGPSTIVGSASYNFFTISAVCNASLAVGE